MHDLISRFETSSEPRSPIGEERTQRWAAPRPGQETVSLYRPPSRGTLSSRLSREASVTSLAEQASIASGSAASVRGLEDVLLPGEKSGTLLRSATVELYDFDPPRDESWGAQAGRPERGWTQATASLFEYMFVLSRRSPGVPDPVHMILPFGQIASVRSTKIVSVLPPAPMSRRRYPLEIKMVDPGDVILSFGSARERLEFCIELEFVSLILSPTRFTPQFQPLFSFFFEWFCFAYRDQFVFIARLADFRPDLDVDC